MKIRIKISQMAHNVYLRWFLITAILFASLVGVFGFFLSPNINYEGVTNGTTLFWGETHSLKAEAVPTIINGITAVTSIIVAFSGVLIGLVYREDFAKDKISKLALLGFIFYFVVPFIFLLVVYNSLIYGALTFALKWALQALVIALSEFVFSALIIFYKLDNQKGNDDPSIGEDM